MNHCHGKEMDKTTCEEKRGPLETYQKPTRAYADGVEKLRPQMGTMDKPEYDALYRITDELRAGVVEAREELNAHVKLHGCKQQTALDSFLKHRSTRF